MSRPASDATKVKHLTRQLRIAREALDKALGERNGYRNQAAVLSAEVTDWKRRFDALLKLQESEQGSASRKQGE